MKGDAVSPQLAGEIQPSFTFPVGVEFRYLEQWNKFSIATQVTEVGGVSPTRFQLRNPAVSNVVGVVEHLVCNSSVALDTVQLSLGTQGADLTAVLTGQRLDRRIQVATGNLIPSSATSGGPASPQIGLFGLAPTGEGLQMIYTENQEIPILPGDALVLSPTGVAAGSVLTVWTMWRERFLEESERA